jgi:hypothetical protein
MKDFLAVNAENLLSSNKEELSGDIQGREFSKFNKGKPTSLEKQGVSSQLSGVQ